MTGKSQPVGVLTGGGDAPGLNAALCGVTRRLASHGQSVLGFRDGWRGLLEGDVVALSVDEVSKAIGTGGTLLGASSASPYRVEGGVAAARRAFAEHDLQALVAIGGDGTLQSAERLWREEGLPVVGIPKTIDNDVAATDFTFGFFTAVERVTTMIDQLRTTAASHHRVMVVECMGRHAGWIAAYSGVAAGCEAVLVPERPVALERLFEKLAAVRAAGAEDAVVVVAEGARLTENGTSLSHEDRDEFGEYRTGDLASQVAARVQAALGWESRGVVLGHLQRAGSPIAFDRIFALRLGAKAGRLVVERRFGRMAALRNGEVIDVPLDEAVAELKKLSDRFLDRYEDFFVPDLI